MEFSRQEYWSGVPCSPPKGGNLGNTGIKPVSLMSPAPAGEFFTTSPERAVTADDCDFLKLLMQGVAPLVSMAQKFIFGGLESWIAIMFLAHQYGRRYSIS